MNELSMKASMRLVGWGLSITSIIGLGIFYSITKSSIVFEVGIMMLLISFVWGAILLLVIQNKIRNFSLEICNVIDGMIQNEPYKYKQHNEEMLLSKIMHRLNRLYWILKETRGVVIEEKHALQSFISDISHQVKTPLANLELLHDTLREVYLPEEKRMEFLEAQGNQLKKLDFLIESLIKISRLETGLITLKKEDNRIYDTLASCLGQIYLSAEKKAIQIKVECEETIRICHDRKWTEEAILNILDNAIKYTPNNGSIKIKVEKQEMYSKISVIDTGKGISEKHHAQIFKRFYRERDVHDIEGIGVGLSLARDIIAKQGGYIKVISEVAQGATFSIYLPNQA